MKINYQTKLDEILEMLENEKPTLLLHSCCAPCSSYVLEYLQPFFKITIFYYNPNINTKEEYEKRVDEVKRLVKEMEFSDVTIEVAEHRVEEFTAIAKGYEHEPERGARCYRCYRLRLEEAALMAKKLNCDYFTTTLSISPHKNSTWLNEIGEEMATKYQQNFLPSDFKKKGGYQRSIELSKIYDLYRQNYCGCIYSQKEALNRVKSTETKDV